jgi:hypothetical protein
MEGIKLPKNIVKRSPLKSFMKWLKWAFLLMLVCIIGAAIFIKLNPTVAADITDNYLRPLIGDQRVIFLENIFFNISDVADRLVYQFKKPESPQFLGQSKNPQTSSTLDLTPIPVNQTLQPLSGEGIWNNLASADFPNTEVMASTFVRPDSQRSFTIVSIVQIDTKLLGIGSVAGIKEPGGSLKNFGTGVIPQNVLDNGNLIAAFNGGFLYNDGKYGMIVGAKTYVPLKIDAGTLVAYADGSVKILNYTGDNLGKNVVFARQNGPLIIDNNGETILSPSDYKIVRGRIFNGKKVLPNGIFTWRSGIGINKNGNLLYAVGNNLSPNSLTDALYLAGAESAIQLDINPSHVHFYVFNKTSGGAYNAIFLNKELERLNRSAQYLTGSPRDFFYLYKK